MVYLEARRSGEIARAEVTKILPMNKPLMP